MIICFRWNIHLRTCADTFPLNYWSPPYEEIDVKCVNLIRSLLLVVWNNLTQFHEWKKYYSKIRMLWCFIFLWFDFRSYRNTAVLIIFLIYACKELFIGINMLHQSLNINTFGHLVICKAWFLFWYTHVFLNFLFLLIDYLIETFVERRDERMALSTLCLFVNMTNHMTLNVIITQCQAFWFLSLIRHSVIFLNMIST